MSLTKEAPHPASWLLWAIRGHQNIVCLCQAQASSERIAERADPWCQKDLIRRTNWSLNWAPLCLQNWTCIWRRRCSILLWCRCTVCRCFLSGRRNDWRRSARFSPMPVPIRTIFSSLGRLINIVFKSVNTLSPPADKEVPFISKCSIFDKLASFVGSNCS